ncbi:MAG: chemotaxis protein methyltransferase [Candidatus Methanoperedens nitroreducens]|uniref:protein-glutamate O-methyltransferase n=1 Tax=Candidatus Methanoperedens nitratireducens TaxID=1392998 RepID=A0A0P7ZG55_9EURY|nr:protein-glutamate O-methyltransferase CheR [Candidatus Methanoperedens sp. BLZ2]KAB2944816.1 MAG: protein-glutamate O-methyltransferase CheR [Candidatus Methanoperedens sp.]KPQ42603.1 MAG: chemotaxis protein methyltransferase [Candidatus Methanoperedens sp. BLZ1]MBZ0177106.1 protein-glutamate O-methyltransferase CheR [Candidatus Methanoperedens nitroreducens]MCX9077537.1 protein-glutamate O-methyltransferase CheR [Candidatus Methanoperedens sp.]
MMNLLTDIIHEDEKEFSELKSIIKRKIGFNCEDYKQPHLKRRLAVRLRATESKSYRDYAQMLSKSEDEVNKLKETLTVNVTELFRNPETFDSVRNNVLPELIKQKGINKVIKVWSAGCSNGEEPYSIAIMLNEFLGHSIKRYNISIQATDIDDDSIAKAETAIFQPKQLEKIGQERINRFFIKKDNNNYQVIDEVKKLVKVKRHDLISGPKFSGFDIIFCRNVTIYFEQSLQEILYMNFYNALNDGGYFVMGKTETLVGPSTQLFKRFDLKERIFQKREKI